MHPPQTIAHRGASAAAPENTLAAFRLALEMDADGVELDVHLSADGEPVVIHDPLLRRTTSGDGLVGDQDLTALRRLDAGRWFDEGFAGERIPTLAEALECLRVVRVIVEIKSGPASYPRIAARVAAVVRASGHPSITISSFDHPVLLEMHAAAPHLETAVLYVARLVDPVRAARDARAGVLHPQWAHVTPDVVSAAHGAGLRVETWVVDEPADMARLAEMGVDGIMTNYPDRLRSVLLTSGFSRLQPGI